MSQHRWADNFGLEQLETVWTGRQPVPDRLEQLTQRLADLGEVWNELEIVIARTNEA